MASTRYTRDIILSLLLFLVGDILAQSTLISASPSCSSYEIITVDASGNDTVYRDINADVFKVMPGGQLYNANISEDILKKVSSVASTSSDTCFILESHGEGEGSIANVLNEIKAVKASIRAIIITGQEHFEISDIDYRCKIYNVCSRHPYVNLCSAHADSHLVKLNSNIRGDMVSFMVAALTDGPLVCHTSRKVPEGYRSIHPLSKRRLSSSKEDATKPSFKDKEARDDIKHIRHKRLLPMLNLSVSLPDISAIVKQIVPYIPRVSIQLGAGVDPVPVQDEVDVEEV